ncbi:MAG TPA: DUF3179 domain-containing (seleno)protein, partial [Bacteroidia bacterium]|nr:DUF3179 domain-containing (seleno)protein [Bacteroidia bacterium]
MKLIFWLLLVIALVAAEFFKVYFIMPFPGSQESDTIDLAYSLHNYIWYIRLPLWALAAFLLYKIFNRGRNWQKITSVALLAFYCVVVYMFNFRFLADKMFLQPESKVMAKPAENIVPKDMVVLGVVINGEARAYPVEIIGYHHQVLDTVGGKPVMVTYCTVCRTGRVFSPMVDGKYETFRLVGMDHFNAMFEDATTKSWWRQVNGEAIKGPMAGKKLEELNFTQTTLDSWLERHPESLILQFDPKFTKKYEGLSGYDRGTIGG